MHPAIDHATTENQETTPDEAMDATLRFETNDEYAEMECSLKNVNEK